MKKSRTKSLIFAGNSEVSLDSHSLIDSVLFERLEFTQNGGFIATGICKTNTESNISLAPNDDHFHSSQSQRVKVKAKNTKAILPIGRTARLACQLEALRAECCKAAAIVSNQLPLNESELEECARLDDALAQAQHLLKSTVARLIMSRLKRRSRAGNSGK